MTTDITELAQSLKAAAEKATPGPWGVARDGKTLVSNQSHPIATVSDAMHRMLADGSTGKDAEFIALANPANVLALVEALEKSQQRNAELENCAEAEATGADKAAEDSVYWMRRCKELESRAVPVKFPHQTDFDDPLSAYEDIEKCKDALTAAGIKWEAE